MARQLIAFLFRDRSWSVVLGPRRLRSSSGALMLFDLKDPPGLHEIDRVRSIAPSFSNHKLCEFFAGRSALFDDSVFFPALVCDYQARFILSKCIRSARHKSKYHQGFFHLSFLLLCVALFNIHTFAANCSPSDCGLYTSPEYQGCSPTTGNNQYQCGGGSGSCSDVCGGCGLRIRTSGYMAKYQAELDDYCSGQISCPNGTAKCTGLQPLRTISIGLCGVGFESDFDAAPICVCVNEPSSSSTAPSSSVMSSEVLQSSSSTSLTCQTFGEAANNPHILDECSNPNAGDWTGCAGVATFENDCRALGWCGAFEAGSVSATINCYLGIEKLHYGGASGGSSWKFIGCRYQLGSPNCPQQSSAAPSSAAPSSAAPSSDSGGGSSDSGGGDSSAGGSSDSGGGGSGGDGGIIPCGWGDWPPCIVEPIEPEFCVKNPDLCYTLGGIDDTIANYGRAITDSLGRIIGRLDSLNRAGAGSCLDSADCPAADWSGDTIDYVPGDSAYSGSGSGDGGASSWLRSILSAASIPAASRSCPAFPTAEVNLPGSSSPYVVNFDICSERWYIAGHHPAELIGLFFRAVACLVAVFIVLGSLTSLNGGFAKMRLLGK